MTSKVNLPRGDIKLGDVRIKDVTYPVIIDLEWMRALAALVDRTGGVIAPTTTEIINRLSIESAFPAIAGEDGADGFGFPGPQGIQGAPGLTFRGQDGEDGNDGFGFPGAKGDRGLQGLDFRGSDGEDGQDATGMLQWPLPRTGTGAAVFSLEGNCSFTVTAGTGAITTASVSSNYTKIGRLVTITGQITITDNGTGGSYLILTGLPFTPSRASCGVGREGAINGHTCIVYVSQSSNAVQIYKYDNTYPVATGSTVNFSASYTV